MDFFGIFLNFLGIFWKKLAKNGSKNGGNRASTTSSSSEFCADFKNGRLFGVGPAAVPENRHFLRKVNPITVVVFQTNLADLVVYQSGRTGNFVTMKLIATRKRK